MHDESTKQPCCNLPWEPPQVIPAQVRRVNNLIFRKINQFHRENNVDNVTPMHDWIMSYLYWHKNEPVYQRDIEREFSITRSTVTNILQLMERKGYIERQSVPQDARLKRLILTEEGGRVHEKTMLSLHQTDEFVAGLLTEEENAELLRLLNKLRKGLENEPERGGRCTVCYRLRMRRAAQYAKEHGFDWFTTCLLYTS